MTVDRVWFQRNVGFDPIERPAPRSTFKIKKAASPTADIDDVRREMIEFDSEGQEGMSFMAFSKATGLSRFTEIPWPKGSSPRPTIHSRRPRVAGCPRPTFSLSHGRLTKDIRRAGC